MTAQAAGSGAGLFAPARRLIAVHGLLGLPLAVIGYPLAIWIPAHYAGGLGLSLAAVGTILMLARFTDVITDPIMGEISDRFRTRLGRRKPWILLGVPVMMLGAWFLFVPPEGVGVLYFLLWLTVFFVGVTMIALPYRAWGAELSTDYHTRSLITASREFFVIAGLIVAAAVPMVVEITADGGTGIGEVAAALWRDAIGAFTGAIADKVPTSRAALTGPVLTGLAIAVLVSLPLTALIVTALVPEPPAAMRERVPLREGMRIMWRNGPMRRVIIITFLVIMGESSRNAVSLFFIRDIIGVPTIGAAYFLYFVAGIAAIPFWLHLGRRFGKHIAFMVTLVFVSFVSISNLFLGQGDYFVFFCLFLLKGFAFGGLQFLPLAMLADVVDIDTARSRGGRRAGTYFAVLGLSEKLAVAIGTGLALNIVGFLGFNAVEGVAGSSELGVRSLYTVYCLGPVLFYGLALPLIWGYPLTPERHQRLRSALDMRARRLAAGPVARQLIDPPPQP
ncbi:MAG: MFS transporter [Alphaproteobacteria bacterium]|nr:MFS transporter [Alphaproteobacteria bacterium]